MTAKSKVSNDVLDAARDLQSFCKLQKWLACFIGGADAKDEPEILDRLRRLVAVTIGARFAPRKSRRA